MIVEQLTKTSYAGDGITTAFPIPFHFTESQDVKAVILDATTGKERAIEKDYYIDTASNVFYYPGYAPGQEAPMAERPPVLSSQETIFIYRDTPENQPVDLGEKYPLPIIEKMVDKLCMIAQEHAELLDRCVKGSISSKLELESVVIEEIYQGRDDAVAAATAAAASETAAAASAAAAAESVTQSADRAAAAAVSAYNAAASETEAATNAAEAQRQKDYAAANTNSALVAMNEARQHAQDSADSAAGAATAKDGAQYWANLANDYVEPLRQAMLKGMFEFDANADLQLVENPLAAVSTMWETDADGDVMPVA